ncbi:hypothetical protein BT69DRAFT_1317336 [Atractiella rhizophila]|nr:hypothetical protein BT69DRAFT_1317336 [Atractiella rhizophila]
MNLNYESSDNIQTSMTNDTQLDARSRSHSLPGPYTTPKTSTSSASTRNHWPRAATAHRALSPTLIRTFHHAASRPSTSSSSRLSSRAPSSEMDSSLMSDFSSPKSHSSSHASDTSISAPAVALELGSDYPFVGSIGEGKGRECRVSSFAGAEEFEIFRKGAKDGTRCQEGKAKVPRMEKWMPLSNLTSLTKSSLHLALGSFGSEGGRTEIEEQQQVAWDDDGRRRELLSTWKLKEKERAKEETKRDLMSEKRASTLSSPNSSSQMDSASPLVPFLSLPDRERGHRLNGASVSTLTQPKNTSLPNSNPNTISSLRPKPNRSTIPFPSTEVQKSELEIEIERAKALRRAKRDDDHHSQEYHFPRESMGYSHTTQATSLYRSFFGEESGFGGREGGERSNGVGVSASHYRKAVDVEPTPSTYRGNSPRPHSSPYLHGSQFGHRHSHSLGASSRPLSPLGPGYNEGKNRIGRSDTVRAVHQHLRPLSPLGNGDGNMDDESDSEIGMTHSETLRALPTSASQAASMVRSNTSMSSVASRSSAGSFTRHRFGGLDESKQRPPPPLTLTRASTESSTSRARETPSSKSTAFRRTATDYAVFDPNGSRIGMEARPITPATSASGRTTPSTPFSPPMSPSCYSLSMAMKEQKKEQDKMAMLKSRSRRNSIALAGDGRPRCNSKVLREAKPLGSPPVMPQSRLPRPGPCPESSTPILTTSPTPSFSGSVYDAISNIASPILSPITSPLLKYSDSFRTSSFGSMLHLSLARENEEKEKAEKTARRMSDYQDEEEEEERYLTYDEL